MDQEPAQTHLEDIFYQMRPKIRYMSEMHIEDYTDSIYKEIINGDLEVSKEKMHIQENPQKKDYQQILRKKFLSQVQQEKFQLQHKLDYISNSINALKKYEDLQKYRSPRSLRASFSVSNSRESQSWREKIKERGEDLMKLKKLAEQRKNKKDKQMKQIQQRIQKEEEEKKKKQIQTHLIQIKERGKNRQEIIREGKQRYQRVMKQKCVYEKLSESYQQKQMAFLQEKKKKLAQIRSFHRPIDENEIRQHEQRFFQVKKQKQEMRERQKRMNQSRTRSYKPSYESFFYKQIRQSSQIEFENQSQIKVNKMKQFSDRIREKFVPEVDERKREELIQFIEKEKRREQIKAQRQSEGLQKYRNIGLEYLEEIKKLPKNKKKGKESIEQVASKTDRIKYKNYITHHERKNSAPWHKILNSSTDKQTKALQLQFQSERMEEQLKRKEQKGKVIKKDQNDQNIDQEYYNMIKAKLELLKSK